MITIEQYSFFKSVNGDRKYNADHIAEYFANFIGNGIFPNPSTNLEVVGNDDMTVTVKIGKAWISGRLYYNDSDLVKKIDQADGALNRIDRVVVRLDMTNREIKAHIKKGEYADVAVAPTLQRDADVYELAIADIVVSAGCISIADINITDQRFDNELCGVVNSLIKVDINTITKLFTEDFTAWFDDVKGILGEDEAGNLLQLIEELDNKIREIKETKATETKLGMVKVDGKSIAIDENGVISSYIPPVYLYNAGDQCIPITGGWVRGMSSTTSSDWFKITYGQSEISMFCNANSGYIYGVLQTKEMIDVSEFKKIRTYWIDNGKKENCTAEIFLSKESKSTSGIPITSIQMPFTQMWTELNTESLEGEYYVHVKIVGNNHGNHPGITICYIEGVK